jgi:hypothetical protein
MRAQFIPMRIDISKKKDEAIFVFIDPFKSALHVSGDNFSHLQDNFDCI